MGRGPWFRGEHQHLEGAVGGQVQAEVVQVEVAHDGVVDALDAGAVFADIVLSSLPMLAAYFVAQRWIVHGLSGIGK